MSKKRKYSVLQNCGYVMKDCLVSSPGTFVHAALFAVMSTGASILGACIAPMIVEGLEESRGILWIVLSAGTMAAAVALMNVLTARFQALYSAAKSKCRQQFIIYLDQKVARMDFQALEQLRTQVRINQAADLLFTDSDGVGINRMHEGVRGLFSTALGIGTCMVLLQRLSIWVSVLAAAVSAANALLNFWDNSYVRRNRDQWAGADKKLSYLNRRLTEKEYGMDIRAYHCIDWIREKFSEAITERGKWQERILRRQTAAQCYQTGLILLYNGAVLAYIVWSVLTGRISVSEFVLYMGLIAQLSGFYDRMFGALNNLAAGSRDVQVIREFLEREDRKGKQAELIKELGEGAVSIRFEHVTFRYEEGGRDILSDFNLTIEPGEKIALIGENGAGKSTLIKLLCGLYAPSEGKIFVNEIPITDYAPECIWKLFSVVFQDFVVFPLSIAQNVAIAAPEKIDRARVRECLEQVGLMKQLPGLDVSLVKEASENGIELSGGQIQKLLIARAMYKNASVFLLDEPTAALDPIAEAKLYSQYNDMVNGKTSVFVSHRLASTRFCDRILYLKDGKITEEGTHEQLLAAGKDYAELFGVQSRYYVNKADIKESSL